MSIMAQPRIAAHTPTACAACYGQYHQRIHVDYASAIEGGPIADQARSPRVDWVVICEDCLRAGVELLPERAGRVENLERQVEHLTERAEQAEDYAATLEDAISRRPDVEPSREPRAPRPKAKGNPRQPRYQKAA